MVKKQYKILTLLFLAAHLCVGQNIEIKSFKTKVPIKNVFIYNKDKTHTTLSDSLGKASLEGFKRNDILFFQHSAYEEKQIELNTYVQEQPIYLKRKIVALAEFVFSASKQPENINETPYFIKTLGIDQLESEGPQTSADMLNVSGNVMIQKSQLGGGSPILRGFEANKVLLVVDGIRMNNAIYRSGHLQNVITIDNFSVDKTEVLFGPSSVVYGSDALGGVMHFYTKKPTLSYTDSLRYQGGALIQYSSVNDALISNINVSVGKKKFGSLTSITASGYGDQRIGENRSNTGYPEGFGQTPLFIQTVEGKDSVITNPDPNMQTYSGYRQFNLMQKFLLVPSEKTHVDINIQYSNSSDIPRYDQLSEYSNGNLRFSEWSYGPQERLLSAVSTTIESKTKLYDQAKLIFGYQNIKESRITRGFQQTNRTIREEKVNIGSFSLDFLKGIKENHQILYGGEVIYNDVLSNAYSENILTKEKAIASTRYPDGGSNVANVAGYINYKWNKKNTLTTNIGLRYNYNSYRSVFEDTLIYQLPFDQIQFSNGALSGSGGIAIHPNNKWKLGLIFSTGFRSPNVDDYGKIFARDDFVVIPSNTLKPEYVYNGEVNFRRRFMNIFQITSSLYYTFIQDAIVRKQSSLGGTDSLQYDGEMYRINTNTNADQAYIYGGSVNIEGTINEIIKTEGSINYTFGQDISNQEPLGHIPPIFGKVKLTYLKDKFHLSTYAYYNGKKDWSRYNFSGVDNHEKAIDGVGTPSWYTLNISGGYWFTTKIKAQLAVENVLDTYYRPFASGISAPGRNINVTVKVFI